jgi:beta-lactam-binding protein with PASTA domain
MNGFAVFIVSFATSVATAAGTVYAIDHYQLLKKPVVVQKKAVPEVVGLSEGDAQTNLAASGLKLLVAGREPNVEAEPGTVIKQSPAPGAELEEGQTVKLTFALAIPKVPDVLGKSVADATRVLTEVGYTVQVADGVPSKDHAAGLIFEQSPKADTPLAKKQSVVITPSGGAGMIEVPKVLGLSVAGAKALIEKANLTHAVQWVSLAETPTFVVLRQIPNPGESVEPQSEVKVVVNQ